MKQVKTYKLFEKKREKTEAGHRLFHDGDLSWIDLDDIKDLNPIKIYEGDNDYSLYVIDNEIYIASDNELSTPERILNGITESYIEYYHQQKDYLKYIKLFSDIFEVYKDFLEKSMVEIYEMDEYKEFLKKQKAKDFNL